MCENNEINIIYTMDDNFAMQAGVSMASLFENNKKFCFHIYVLSDCISEKNKSKLVDVAKRYNYDIEIIEMPNLEKCAGVVFSTHGWAKAAYSRLFLCELLPKDMDRIVYIDPDTIIIDEIDDLVEHMQTKEFDSYYAYACLDAVATFRRLHGFKRKENYYNTGFMLINLKKWRDDGIQKVFNNELKRREGKSIDVDQSYINCIMINKIYTLPAKYNVMALYFNEYSVFLEKSELGIHETYSKQELQDAVKHPVVVHFAGDKRYRPWYSDCKHSMKDMWFDYLKKTEWADFVPTEKAPIVSVKQRALREKIKKQILKTPYLCLIYTKHAYGFWVKVFRKGL